MPCHPTPAGMTTVCYTRRQMAPETNGAFLTLLKFWHYCFDDIVLVCFLSCEAHSNWIDRQTDRQYRDKQEENVMFVCLIPISLTLFPHLSLFLRLARGWKQGYKITTDVNSLSEILCEWERRGVSQRNVCFFPSFFY